MLSHNFLFSYLIKANPLNTLSHWIHQNSNLFIPLINIPLNRRPTGQGKGAVGILNISAVTKDGLMSNSAMLDVLLLFTNTIPFPYFDSKLFRYWKYYDPFLCCHGDLSFLQILEHLCSSNKNLLSWFSKCTCIQDSFMYQLRCTLKSEDRKMRFGGYKCKEILLNGEFSENLNHGSKYV